MSTASGAVHTGAREEKVISGTTNARAHGWTAWSGVYHYTRARMEDIFLGINLGVLTDSGRIWGYNSTEAISSWWAISEATPGSARTYCGQE